MTGRLPKKHAAATKDCGLSIVLVNPQLGENIGTVARAMLNCAVIDLRLVKPRDNWLNEKTIAAASGADMVLDRIQIFDTTAQAIADLQRVYATTGRARHMTKKVMTPRHAAKDMRKFVNQGGQAGIIFGRESRGLDNDDIALADAMVRVPLNPKFCSLNLAQSVLLMSHEWFQTSDDTPALTTTMPKHTRPANKEELITMFEHLERELDACGFLRVKEKRPVMVQNLRNMFQRAQMTEQEVRTFHGVIKGLATKWKN